MSQHCPRQRQHLKMPGGQSSLMGFFKPKPAGASDSPAPPSSGASSSGAGAAPPGKRSLQQGGSQLAGSNKRPNTSSTPSTEGTTQQASRVEGIATAGGAVAEAISRAEATPTSAASAVSCASSSSRAPNSSGGAGACALDLAFEMGLRPPSAEETAEVYAAATGGAYGASSFGAVNSVGGDVKEVSFPFLRDRRDAKGDGQARRATTRRRSRSGWVPARS